MFHFKLNIMIIARIIVFLFFLILFPKIITSSMNTMKKKYNKTKSVFRRIYRTLTVKNSSYYVWKELIKHHQSSGWRYGQFDNDKLIECTFKVHETNNVNFNYSVSDYDLTFRSTLLENFDEEFTNDIFVLASHFNALLNFGVVKVSTKYNCVDFVYLRHSLVYSLFPGEISSDTATHFQLTKDCLWAFTNLIETKEAPVFVIAELLKKREDERNENNIKE